EYSRPKVKEGFPHYYLGDISWRGIDVPLLSFEEVNGGDRPPKNTEVRIAVLNNTGTDSQRLPFVAILTQGLPRLVKVSEDIIQHASKSDLPAEHSRIRVDGEEAVIPNLNYLESLAINLV
ncbi:hypothetical protein A3765_23600, partial [Oleiphilus sp. HI0130]